MEKLMEIWLQMGSGSEDKRLATKGMLLNWPGTTRQKPILSMPRRPARPVICKRSVAERSTNSRPLKRSLWVTTTVRAGKFTPAATVEVEKMAFKRPRCMSRSTISFQWGR